MGPVPSSVTVADPATVPSSATPSTAAMVFGGPALDGTYRLDYDYLRQTVNDAPTHGSLTTGTDWFAFHSACTSSGCAATGAKLGGVDHKDNTGVVEVLHFIDDHWRDTPYLEPPLPSNQCSGDNGTVADTETMTWSLQPQADGTLRGTTTEAVLSNECGKQGTVWTTPTTATRVGDVPPGVVLADPALFTDPALFKSPAAPATTPPGG